MILGLMLAMTACSVDPDPLLDLMKGSYIQNQWTVERLTASGDFVGITSVGATTIDALNFSMPVNDSKEVAFEYIEVQHDMWLIYKATYNGKVNYTAFAAGADGSILMEDIKFYASQADVEPSTLGIGFKFLAPATKNTEDQSDSSVMEGTVAKASN